MSYGVDEYRALVRRFAELVRSAVPADATVAVVSKGDAELLEIDGRAAWHFPQRTDGTYAGLPPLQQRQRDLPPGGAAGEGRRPPRLPRPLAVVARPLRGAAAAPGEPLPRGLPGPGGRRRLRAPAGGRERQRRQAGAPPPTQTQPQPQKGQVGPRIALLAQALLRADRPRVRLAGGGDRPLRRRGAARGRRPPPALRHQLVPARYPEAAAPGSNPLLHFIAHSPVEEQDPGPYFDTAYYYDQVPRLHKNGKNALVHYVDPEQRSAHPNALFRDGYYRDKTRKASTSAPTPLEHYLRYGRDEGRAMSHVHEKLLDQVRGTRARCSAASGPRTRSSGSPRATTAATSPRPRRSPPTSPTSTTSAASSSPASPPRPTPTGPAPPSCSRITRSPAKSSAPLPCGCSPSPSPARGPCSRSATCRRRPRRSPPTASASSTRRRGARRNAPPRRF